MTMPYKEFADIVKNAFTSVYDAEVWENMPEEKKQEIILSHAERSNVEFCE